ncbi:MAG: tetratricopeptide repeat protein [Verrucomicrobiota bacterium]|jgi:tetratricopeptide (TPR) repeat protein|nr:tetratricopeptide repeat protein [Verrucomicrobiota bacterium]
MARKKKRKNREVCNSNGTGNPALEQTLQVAIRHHEQENLSEAKAIYRQVLEEDPDNVDANHYMGVLAHQAGRNDIAIGLIQKAIECNPNRPEIHCNLGIVYKQMGLLKDAIASYRYALALKPHHAEAHYNLGIILRSQGLLKEAETSYRKALKSQPGNDEIHNNLGMVMQEMGRIDEAIACFRKAAAINPGNTSARGNLALALKAPDLIQVADMYWKILHRQPENAEAYHKLGQILNELSRHEEAAACFRKALICAKDKTIIPRIHFDLGNALVQLSQLKDAMDSFHKVLEHHPENAGALTNLGGVLRELGLYAESEVNLRKATTIQPNRPDHLLNLAVTLKRRGVMPEALQVINQAMDLIPAKQPKLNGKCPDKNHDNIVALLPFGRSGSLFLHSLLDNHPEVSTLPGVYLRGYFGQNTWHILNSRTATSDHQGLVEEFCDQFEPLFDARSKKRVFGDPFGIHTPPGSGSGFDKMGDNRDQCLSLNRETFQAHLRELLAETDHLDNKVFFQLIHQAYDLTLGRNDGKKLLFYHIHNPTFFEGVHFLKRFPTARFLVTIREPVQGLESWLRAFYPEYDDVMRARNHSDKNGDRMVLDKYGDVAERVGNFFDMADPLLFEINSATGIRLEDIKRRPRETMPALAEWMGIRTDECLYEPSFQDLTYWGPPSKRTPNLRGFDTDNLDRKSDDLFSDKDQFIFRTLLYPTEVHFGYQEANDTTFKKDLKEVGLILNKDEPLDFERSIYGMLTDHSQPLDELGAFLEMHATLKTQWEKLQSNPTFPGKIDLIQI